MNNVTSFTLGFIAIALLLLRMRIAYSLFVFMACVALIIFFSYDPHHALFNGVFTSACFVLGRKIMLYLLSISDEVDKEKSTIKS